MILKKIRKESEKRKRKIYNPLIFNNLTCFFQPRQKEEANHPCDNCTASAKNHDHSTVERNRKTEEKRRQGRGQRNQRLVDANRFTLNMNTRTVLAYSINIL